MHYQGNNEFRRLFNTKSVKILKDKKFEKRIMNLQEGISHT